MTVQLPRISGGSTDDPAPEGSVASRPAPQRASGPTAPGRPADPAAPADLSLPDFVGGAETRLRDLLAFGMAVEAGRPAGPDGVEALRRKAEAELEAHAFRVLHNQVEAIRRQAVDEHLGKARRGLSFLGAVLANLIALGLVAAALLAAGGDVPVLGQLADRIAQMLAQSSAR